MKKFQSGGTLIEYVLPLVVLVGGGLAIIMTTGLPITIVNSFITSSNGSAQINQTATNTPTGQTTLSITVSPLGQNLESGGAIFSRRDDDGFTTCSATSSSCN